MPVTKTKLSPFFSQNRIHPGLTTGDHNPPDFFITGNNIATYGGSVTHDGPVPSYRYLISQGQNATSVLRASETRITTRVGNFVISYNEPPFPAYGWSCYKGEHCEWSPIQLGDVVVADTDDRAKMRFVNACLRELQSFEGQVFLGELAETLRMVKNPLRAFRNSLDSYHDTLRRRRKGSKKHRQHVVSDTWLEFQYGWKPLISDAESGLATLQRWAYEPVRFKPVRASSSKTTEIGRSVDAVQVGAILFNRESITSHNVSVKYYGVCELQTAGIRSKRSDLGFRMDRFVPTLWELLPYSFLIDYFSNVGDVISAWSFGRTGLRWASRGEMKEKVVDQFAHQPTIVNPGPGTYNWIGKEPGQSHRSAREVSRSPYLGSFVPDFRLEIPGMASTKWLNIAALGNSRRSLRPY